MRDAGLGASEAANEGPFSRSKEKQDLEGVVDALPRFHQTYFVDAATRSEASLAGDAVEVRVLEAPERHLYSEQLKHRANMVRSPSEGARHLRVAACDAPGTWCAPPWAAAERSRALRRRAAEFVSLDSADEALAPGSVPEHAAFALRSVDSELKAPEYAEVARIRRYE